jgi:hypothetical protein
MGWKRLNRSFSGEGLVEGSCKHGYEPLGSIKFWYIFKQLHNWLSSMKFMKSTSPQTACSGSFSTVGVGWFSNNPEANGLFWNIERGARNISPPHRVQHKLQ